MALAGCLAVIGCTNNPYPEADRDKKVLYSSFNEAPKTLDPAVAYTTAEHVITGNVYDTLLEYHYLERPYRLIAGLAVIVLLSIAASFYFTADYWSFGDEDEELHAVEGADDVPADASVYVPAIIDLAGDPMWITLAPDADTASKGHAVARPAELDSSGASPQIEILSDVMLSASEKFMTTIPPNPDRTGAAPG